MRERGTLILRQIRLPAENPINNSILIIDQSFSSEIDW